VIVYTRDLFEAALCETVEYSPGEKPEVTARTRRLLLKEEMRQEKELWEDASKRGAGFRRTPQRLVPHRAFGITARPDELLQVTMDALERRRSADPEVQRRYRDYVSKIVPAVGEPALPVAAPAAEGRDTGPAPGGIITGVVDRIL
jgi:hypothetical protein